MGKKNKIYIKKKNIKYVLAKNRQKYPNPTMVFDQVVSDLILRTVTILSFSAEEGLSIIIIQNDL